MLSPVARHRPILLMMGAVALVAWGAIGLYQGLHRGFSGGLYDPHYVMPGVVPGSAAERAGFRAGDRVISVDGTPVEELGMESRWPRSLAAQIGQSRRFLVERNGAMIPLDYVYGAPSQSAVNNRIGVAIVGLGFLCLGVWASIRVRTPAAITLGYIGLAAGVQASLGLGPNLGTWNGVMGHISTAAAVLVFILLLRFLEIFPKPKPLSESRTATWAIYVPWLGLLAFLGVELIVHPALYYTIGSVAFPLMLVYGILVVAAITHTVVKSSGAELVRTGMVLILVGFLIAIFGMVAAFTSLLPVPGWGYSLLLLAVPFTMAMAVRKQARLEGTQTTG
jgi:membrane-associated protease RseP (regulator of RpoE activity)